MESTTNRLALTLTRDGWRAAILGSCLIIGCSASSTPDPVGTGGSSTGGTSQVNTGGSTSGGAPTSGGASSFGGSVVSSGGLSQSGGASQSGGSSGASGSATGGASGSSGSSGMGQGGSSAGHAGQDGGGKGGASGGGGTSSAGNGGTSNMGGSGGASAGASSGGKAAAMPSSGCGKSNPQTGSSGSPLNVSNHQYYVKLPSGYDANKPYPTIFMFNPTNNPLNWAEQNAGFESNGAKDAAIRVYPGPLSMQNGWGANDVSFFQPLYDQITANFCVDKARVFAAGESSGGDFASILGCEHADKLRSVGPCATKDVGNYPLDASKRKCTGQVTAVVIHGKNDNVVGPANGPKTRDFYVALNHCGSMTTPVQGYTDPMSNCVEYQGCDEGYPVYWCQHTDPEYSNTNHGWPKFANKMLWSLWSSY